MFADRILHGVWGHVAVDLVGGIGEDTMSRKTYRFKLQFEGAKKPNILRTDGIPTHCCSFQTDYFCWERTQSIINIGDGTVI